MRSLRVLLILAVLGTMAGCSPRFWYGTAAVLGAASSGAQAAQGNAITPIGPPAIQGQVTGASQGFSQGATFTLSNGQVWQQVESYTWHNYAYSPQATIFFEGGVYKMRLAGIDHPVAVRRIR